MRLLLLTFAAVSLFAFACGGDDDAQPTAEPTGPAAARTSTSTPGSPTEPASQTGEQLSYARNDQSVWLYNTSNGEQREIIASGMCGTWSSAEWNHDGTMLAMMCGTSAESDIFITHIFDETGRELERLPGHRLSGWSPASNYLLLFEDYVDENGETRDRFYIVNADVEVGVHGRYIEINDAMAGAFSPDGSSLAYYLPTGADCGFDCSTGLFITNLDEGTQRVYGDVVPQVWVRGGQAIIAESQDVRTPEEGYGVFLVDVESGEEMPLPGLDGYTQYWVKPDGAAVVFLSYEGNLGLAVLDLATLSVTRVAGSRISYPSDHIPTRHVALSDDVIYWFDGTGKDSPWFSAKYDGTELKELGEAQSYFLSFSPSLRYVAYPTTDMESVMTVARTDGSGKLELGPSGFTLVWRPTGD